ncbi:MAG TPA: outer membrane beta-barrel protein [Candidatus Limnocylindrales bacterium]|nr:outer membrane beta-barrel protein [Candidatus Limnocylindrales bacterium]
MKKFIALLAAGALATGSSALAQADEGGPNLTFGASTSFTFDFNDPDRPPGLAVQPQNERLYANIESEESFNIDLVQLGVSGTRGPVSYGAKVDFGDLARFTGDDDDGDIGLQELFLAIDTGFVTVSAGRVPTPIGYESLEPWSIPNISHSRAWLFQPVNHDGLAVSGEVGNFSGMIGVVNGFAVNDPVGNNIDDEYGIIGYVGAGIADTNLRLSGIYSEESDQAEFIELNLVVSGNVDRFRYGAETTWLDVETDDPFAPTPPFPAPVPDSRVWDVTGYFGGTWSGFSLDLRLSYTHENDTDATRAGATANTGIWSVTSTGGYEITDGVVFRAEYRVDVASDDVFLDEDAPNEDVDHVIQAQLMWTPAIGD